MSLPEVLVGELREAHTKLTSQGAILTDAQIAKCCAAFASRFGPDALARLDGEALLGLMHLPGNYDSVIYWLELKNDDEFPSTQFGSIAGGSAHKFGIFRSSKSGGLDHRKRTAGDGLVG